MSDDTEALVAEYRWLWTQFMSEPSNRGWDATPRQVCFDIDRVERKLKAAGVADPFELVRETDDDIKAMYGPLDEADMLVDEIPMAPF